MTSALIPLLLAGLMLIVIEIFIPGFGIVGLTGVTLVALSAIFTVIYVPFGFAIVLGELIFIGICMYFIIKWAKEKQLYGSLVLKDILDMEKKEVGNNEALIGREGTTVIPLKPFGSAMFNGIKMEVYSDGAYVPKGRTVKVINIENEKIIVREMN